VITGLRALLRFCYLEGSTAGPLAEAVPRVASWRGAVLGKGSRHELLPLPADVGEAIAGWLRRGRPHCAAREVFTPVRAPYQALSPVVSPRSCVPRADARAWPLVSSTDLEGSKR
jgi:hypothetical protein